MEQSVKEGLVLVIDEYPYLANCYPGISSLLAAMFDHKFLQNANGGAKTWGRQN
ncbi:MAG: hypothetical protein HFH10_09835 [Dorea sp.]|nr:hypothetical protein [Dorea sp.]